MNYADQACLLKSLSLLPVGNVRCCIPVKSLLVANVFFRENRTFPAFKAEFPRRYVVPLIAFDMGRDYTFV
jgi:hypothetical protein